MSTTALRIELLIIGFQATILFILFFVGFDSSIEFYKSNAVTIKDTAAVIVLITLAWCYSLGAMIDGVTAVFEDPKSLLKRIAEPGIDSSVMRLKYPDAYKELIASDFELRLLRSTSFNLLFVGISLWVTFGYSILVGVIFIGCISVGAAWFRRKNKTKLRRDSLYTAANNLP